MKKKTGRGSISTAPKADFLNHDPLAIGLLLAPVPGFGRDMGGARARAGDVHRIRD